MKVCSQPINWACKTLMDARGQCGHAIRKECRQAVDTVECSFRPCVKLRSCGHPCINVCGKDCNLGECGGCEEVRKKEFQKMRHRYSRTLLFSPLLLWSYLMSFDGTGNARSAKSVKLILDTKNLVKWQDSFCSICGFDFCRNFNFLFLELQSKTSNQKARGARS